MRAVVVMPAYSITTGRARERERKKLLPGGRRRNRMREFVGMGRIKAKKWNEEATFQGKLPVWRRYVVVPLVLI